MEISSTEFGDFIPLSYYNFFKLDPYEHPVLKDFKNSYKKLSLFYHPDKNKSIYAEKNMQLLNDAFDKITDYYKNNPYNFFYYKN